MTRLNVYHHRRRGGRRMQNGATLRHVPRQTRRTVPPRHMTLRPRTLPIDRDQVLQTHLASIAQFAQQYTEEHGITPDSVDVDCVISRQASDPVYGEKFVELVLKPKNTHELVHRISSFGNGLITVRRN